jgi:hypothetical protein
MSFGPWISNIDPCERRARLRALRAIASLVTRAPLLVDALARAEVDDEALATASELIDGLEPLPRRRLLTT